MAMVIDLTLIGKQNVLGGLSDVAKALRDLADAQAAVQGAFAKVGKVSNAATQNLNNQSQAASKATGVMSRLIKAQQDYNAALKTGNNVQITDAHDKLLKAQSAFSGYKRRANPTNPMADWLGQLVGTTRLNLGNFSPLVNKLIPGGQKAITASLNNMMGSGGQLAGDAMAGDAASGAMGALTGLSEAAGPIGITIAAVVTLGKAAFDAAQAVKNLILPFQDMKNMTNATPEELGRAQALGGALNLSPSDLTSMAKSFADSIGNGGIGEASAAAAGIRGAHNPLDRARQDDMSKLLEAAQYIVGHSREQDLLLAKTNPAIEKLLNLKDLSPERQQQAMQSLGAIGQDKITAAADFNAELGRASAAFDKIKMTLGTPLLRGAADLFERIAHDLSNIPDLLDDTLRMSIPGYDAIHRIYDHFFGGQKDVKDAQDAAGKKGEKIAANGRDALNRNTAAINENTRSLNNSRQILGQGAEKARGVIPAAWRWAMADQMNYSNANRLGAF